MYTYWKENRRTYIVLQLCEHNFRQELKECSKQTALKYFIEVLEGMNVLIKKRIIHRDIKFENILIKEGIAKITDFGLAKYMGDELAVESIQCGTPYTMAPEILFHNFRHTRKPVYTDKCDVWSLGVLLHEILYDQHPFNYEKGKMERRKRVHIYRKYPLLDRFIDKSLVFEPKSRMCWEELCFYLENFKKIGFDLRKYQ